MKKIIQNRIDKIISRLKTVEEIDRSYKIFGSSSHKYKSTKLSDSEIVEFEKSMKIKLPEELRVFLKQIGYGAGPAYGIYSLAKMKENFEDWNSFFDENSSMSNEFELNNDDANELVCLKRKRPNEFHYKQLTSVNGLLPILTEGCTYYSFIVLNGEQKGKIWNADLNEFYVLPSGAIEEFGFLDWYEKWLDDSLNEMNSTWSLSFKKYMPFLLIEKMRNKNRLFL